MHHLKTYLQFRRVSTANELSVRSNDVVMVYAKGHNIEEDYFIKKEIISAFFYAVNT